MSDKTGGPAFPCDLTMYDKEVQSQMQGMTLRDYFAAKTMQGFASNLGPGATFNSRAETAYEWADAMLKARER
jgi:hypothetical protein